MFTSIYASHKYNYTLYSDTPCYCTGLKLIREPKWQIIAPTLTNSQDTHILRYLYVKHNKLIYFLAKKDETKKGCES